MDFALKRENYFQVRPFVKFGTIEFRKKNVLENFNDVIYVLFL
jgi:hypothetical protein